MFRRSRWKSVIAVIAAVAVLAACGGDDDDDSAVGSNATTTTAASSGEATGEPIKIGLLVDQTANLAVVDSPLTTGIETAVDAVNAEGGINGRPIELVVQDNANDPQRAIAGLELLLTREDVFTVLSGSSSQSGAAIDPVLADAGKIALTITTLGPDTKAQYSFSGTAALTAQMHKEFLESKGITSVGILRDSTPFNQFVFDAVSAAFEDAGIDIVGVEEHAFDVVDLRAQVEKLLSESPGAILKLSSGPSDIVAAKALAQAQAEVPMLGTPLGTSVAQQVGAEYENYFFLAWPIQIADSLDSIPDELSAFRDAFTVSDVDPGWASVGWDMARILSEALRSMDDLDPAGLPEALEQLGTHQGAAAVTVFTKPGHIIDGPIYSYATIKDGAPVSASSS